MRRKLAPLAAVAAAVTAVVAPVASADKPSYGCPPAFNLGAVTFEDYLELPRTQGAIEAGLVDEATLLAVLSQRFEHNGNEVVCVQVSHGAEISNRPFGQYIYNVVDDMASVPS